MVNCLVKGCKNYINNKKPTSKVKYFKFPKNSELAKMWLDACGKGVKVNMKYSRICSDHFDDSDYSMKSQLLNTPFDKKMLKSDAVPTIKLPISESIRKKRYEVRTRKKIVTDLINNYCERERSEHQNINEFHDHEMDVEDHFKICSIGVQTMVDLKCSQQLRNLELQKEVEQLKSKLKKEIEYNSDIKPLFQNLKLIFTSGQIKKLKDPKKKIAWTPEDISSAISLYSSGARSYKYQYRKGFPIPAPRTLRKWAAKVQFNPGIVKPVTQILKGLNYSERDRVGVISFDEMKIKEEYEYDKVSDSTMKPSKYVQVE